MFLIEPLILPPKTYNILPLNNSKLLYPNATLFITLILLFIPSVKPLLYLSSINEFIIYSFHLETVLAASINSGIFFEMHLLIHHLFLFLSPFDYNDELYLKIPLLNNTLF